MQQLPLACFLSLIRPPGISFEDSYLQILPVDKAKCPFVRDHNDITFRLYTRHNPVMFQELKIDDDESLFASNMDFHDPTVIYFSAFLEQPDDGSGLQVRESYMLRGDTNFIILDLSRLEAGPWYFTAAENTWYIGNFAAKLIDYLVSRGLDLKKTHLVGHSLGAQSAGVAGSVLKSGRVSRITGLDPAFPLFDKLPTSQRLDPSDADFVDVIHTDAGIFGFNRPIGHVDFYPNGGISPQPGCELEVVLHEQRLLNKFFCSHWRSYMFYSESVIRPKSFVATSCDSWRHYKAGTCARQRSIHMGYGADRHYMQGEDNAQTHGYYKFSLQGNKRKSKLEDRLKQFFLHINKLKNTNFNTDRSTTTKRNDSSRHTESLTHKKSIKALSNYNRDHNETTDNNAVSLTSTESVKQKNIDKATINKHKHSILKNNKRPPTQVSEVNDSEQIDETNLELLEDIHDTQTYKREKRITTVDDDKDNSTETKEVVKVQNCIANLNTTSDANDVNINTNANELQHSNDTTTKNNTDEASNIEIAIKTRTNADKLQLKTTTKRQKRFISFRNNNDDNFLFRMLEFLMKHRRSVVPIVTVMREINTLVKSANGELNHFTKERNNYIGTSPSLTPINYDLAIGNESKLTAFVKRLLGFGTKGGRLTINGSGK